MKLAAQSTKRQQSEEAEDFSHPFPAVAQLSDEGTG
jgi:hypothetical protein